MYITDAEGVPAQGTVWKYLDAVPRERLAILGDAGSVDRPSGGTDRSEHLPDEIVAIIEFDIRIVSRQYETDSDEIPVTDVVFELIILQSGSIQILPDGTLRGDPFGIRDHVVVIHVVR